MGWPEVHLHCKNNNMDLYLLQTNYTRSPWLDHYVAHKKSYLGLSSGDFVSTILTRLCMPSEKQSGIGYKNKSNVDLQLG